MRWWAVKEELRPQSRCERMMCVQEALRAEDGRLADAETSASPGAKTHLGAGIPRVRNALSSVIAISGNDVVNEKKTRPSHL
jgi:hypothetical protein